MKPKIADLFCGAGGAAMGLHRAGFEVVGFDIKPMPRYPFEFHLQDALTVDLSGFDAAWASPPCQAWVRGLSAINKMLGKKHKDYPALIAPTRELLEGTGKPFIIENIPGAPIRKDVVLCGQAFGLRVFRHRWFESNLLLWAPRHERHNGHTSSDMLAAYHTFENSDYLTVVGHLFRFKDGCVAMGIDWMNRNELTQAIPPAYSEFLGKQLMESLANSKILEEVSP